MTDRGLFVWVRLQALFLTVGCLDPWRIYSMFFSQFSQHIKHGLTSDIHEIYKMGPLRFTNTPKHKLTLLKFYPTGSYFEMLFIMYIVLL